MIPKWIMLSRQRESWREKTSRKPFISSVRGFLEREIYCLTDNVNSLTGGVNYGKIFIERKKEKAYEQYDKQMCCLAFLLRKKEKII